VDNPRIALFLQGFMVTCQKEKCKRGNFWIAAESLRYPSVKKAQA
jgi:hypothetical protein